MPISQIGQINISALNVPDVYVQVAPPQFLFSGVSTNVGGLVGTASWGPVNTAMGFANYPQFASIFGPTVNRTYDMGAHALLAAAQGGAGAMFGVRVTDGSDVAATAPINSTGSIAASGSIVFSVNPSASATITLNGTAWTFVASGATGNQVNIAATLTLTLTALLAALQASADTQTVKFTFSVNATTLYLLAASTGVGGNSLTIAASVATPSGSTLSGGAAAIVGTTLTAKYTGTLGNSLIATLSQGSQNGLALKASGAINFTSNPTAATTISINGTTWTFVSAITTGTQILLGATLAATLANCLIYLQASTDMQTLKMGYATNTSQLVITAKAAGTAGNALTIATNVTGATASGATLAGGAAPTTTVKVTLSLPGVFPEQFDNIGAGLTANALWVAITAAINNGVSSVRGPSALAIATVGAGTAAPTFGSTTLAGGSDGVASITTSTLIGVDTTPRSGMYALRGNRVSQAILCDLSDTTSFSTQAAFGLDIGCYMIGVTAAGDTIANAVTELGNAGIDTYTMKVMFGDWIYWLDTTNNIPQRLTSPQGVVLGVLCNLSPEESSLNKPIQGIIGTQKSLTGIQYSSSDLQQLGQAQMDVISNPEPGGAYFACRFGKNTSSNQVIFGDEYTRVTYFLAKSLLIIGGNFIGKTQSATERLNARTALLAFMQLCVTNGIIGTPDGSLAYAVVLDNSNNTQQTVALGYQYATIQATYLGIVRFFIITLQGGASVVISQTPTLTP